MEGRALGGIKSSGYASDTNPLKIPPCLEASAGSGAMWVCKSFNEFFTGLGGTRVGSMESVRESEVNGFGEASDIGVLRGKGMGCFETLGERGRPGKAFLGAKEGEPRDVPIPSRGILGVGGFIGRWFGRGLKGRPGLIGLMETSLSVMTGPFRPPEGLSTPASEAGGDKNSDAPFAVGTGERALMDAGFGVS